MDEETRFQTLTRIGDRLQSEADRMAEWVLTDQRAPYEVMGAAAGAKSAIDEWTQARTTARCEICGSDDPTDRFSQLDEGRAADAGISGCPSEFHDPAPPKQGQEARGEIEQLIPLQRQRNRDTAPKQVGGDQDSARCESCKGRGRVDCPKCDGYGTAPSVGGEDTQARCGGSGEITVAQDGTYDGIWEAPAECLGCPDCQNRATPDPPSPDTARCETMDCPNTATTTTRFYEGDELLTARYCASCADVMREHHAAEVTPDETAPSPSPEGESARSRAERWTIRVCENHRVQDCALCGVFDVITVANAAVLERSQRVYERLRDDAAAALEREQEASRQMFLKGNELARQLHIAKARADKAEAHQQRAEEARAFAEHGLKTARTWGEQAEARAEKAEAERDELRRRLVKMGNKL